jgi:hypothetical protein
MGGLFSFIDDQQKQDDENLLTILQSLNIFMNYSFALENFDKNALHIIPVKEIPKWVNYFESESKLILLNLPEDDRTIIDSPIGIELERLCIYCIMLLNKQTTRVYDLLKYTETLSSDITNDEEILTLGLPTSLLRNIKPQNFNIRDNLVTQENIRENKYNFFTPFLNSRLEYTFNLTKNNNLSSIGDILPYSLITLYYTNFVRIKKQLSGNLLLELNFINKNIIDLFPFLAALLNYIERYNKSAFNTCVDNLKDLIFMDPENVMQLYPNIFSQLELEDLKEKYKNNIDKEYTTATIFSIIKNSKLELVDTFSKSDTNIRFRLFKEIRNIDIKEIKDYPEWSKLSDLIEKDNINKFKDSLKKIQTNFMENYKECKNDENARYITNDKQKVRQTLCFSDNFSADTKQSFIDSHSKSAAVFAEFINTALYHQNQVLSLVFMILIKYRGVGNSKNE